MFTHSIIGIYCSLFFYWLLAYYKVYIEWLNKKELKTQVVKASLNYVHF